MGSCQVCQQQVTTTTPINLHCLISNLTLKHFCKTDSPCLDASAGTVGAAGRSNGTIKALHNVGSSISMLTTQHLASARVFGGELRLKLRQLAGLNGSVIAAAVFDGQNQYRAYAVTTDMQLLLLQVSDQGRRAVKVRTAPLPPCCGSHHRQELEHCSIPEQNWHYSTTGDLGVCARLLSYPSPSLHPPQGSPLVPDFWHLLLLLFLQSDCSLRDMWTEPAMQSRCQVQTRRQPCKQNLLFNYTPGNCTLVIASIPGD